MRILLGRPGPGGYPCAAQDMPRYDYECEKCGHLFEVFQSMNDPKLTDCPQPGCGGKVKRLLGTGAGVIFKGSGFYQTDYRSDSYKAGAKAEKSATAKPAAGESAKSDARKSDSGSAPKPENA